MDKIWDRKSFEVGGQWPLWRGWKKIQKSNAKFLKYFFTISCIYFDIWWVNNLVYWTRKVGSSTAIHQDNVVEWMHAVQRRVNVVVLEHVVTKMPCVAGSARVAHRVQYVARPTSAARRGVRVAGWTVVEQGTIVTTEHAGGKSKLSVKYFFKVNVSF